jgi:hypothetical protein
MDTSRQHSSYPYRNTSDTMHPTPTKEIYQYDAPWSIYALDWCKTPIEQKSFRLAIGSFIEDSNNKVRIYHKKLFRFNIIFYSYKLYHVLIYLIMFHLQEVILQQ